jgi:hypothetical protein
MLLLSESKLVSRLAAELRQRKYGAIMGQGNSTML